MEIEMISSDETNKDSPSSGGSLFPMSNFNLENLLQEDKKSQLESPPPKSEKGSDEDEAPPLKSNDSDSSPSPKESPSKTSPPASRPPPPPVARPPPPPVTRPPPPPVNQLPHSPPPPPSLSQSPTSSPPPSPLSSDRENPSPGPPEQSASSPDSQDRSFLNMSSNNLPPLSSVIFPSLIKSVPPPPQGEEGIESGSNHHSPPLPPGNNAGSNTRPSGFSNDSVPSTSGGDGGSGSGGDGDAAKYVGIAFAGVCIVVFVALCFLVAKIRKRKRGAIHDVSHIPPNMKAGEDWRYYGLQPLQDDHYKNGSHMGSVQPLGTSEPMQPNPISAQIAFCYENIMEITNGFSSQNIIGHGGFGCVYKGWLADGRVVAVKKLKAGSGQGDREFRAEVETISRVHHRHLVSLVGYCISERQKILIYEFVPNGTLDHHLHGNVSF